MNYKDIPKFLNPIIYRVDSRWKDFISTYIEEYKLDLNPIYQRGHVWKESQDVAFIEFCLKGGTSARQIYLNCPGWNNGEIDNFEVVDGKQRISAIVKFIDNKLKVFGDTYYKDLNGGFHLSNTSTMLSTNVASIEDRNILYQWYLEMNTGGTVHTQEELDKVRNLIEK